MPQPRTPLPEELGDLFTTAGAQAAGVTPTRLRGRDLTMPTSGVRRAASEDPPDLELRARCLALALPDDVAFSHLTAARLLGLPTPRAWPGPGELVDVIRETDRPRVERTGCRHHRGLESRTHLPRGGFRVVGALDTWCDVASTWSEPDLLAVADVILRRGWATGPELLAAVDSRAGTRGVVRMRAVAPLARGGSASPGESRARWWFHAWGLPEPELNVDVHDAHGQWLATVDFRWKERRVVGEYDGDVHRTDRRTWRKDKDRRAAIEDEDWHYVEMTALSLSDWAHREALRRRLTRLLGH
jgi:hypothetical protein